MFGNVFRKIGIAQVMSLTLSIFFVCLMTLFVWTAVNPTDWTMTFILLVLTVGVGVVIGLLLFFVFIAIFTLLFFWFFKRKMKKAMKNMVQ